MVKFKKKEKVTNFKTINGENIKLDIDKKEENIKITIIHSPLWLTYRKAFLWLFMTVVGILCFILNIKIATAIVIFTLRELYKLCTIVREENLVMVKGLGFQVTTKYILGIKTTFIPEEQVQRIFISEVLLRHRVIYILSLLTKEKNCREILTPLFFDTLPRLGCLKVIYKNLKTIVN